MLPKNYYVIKTLEANQRAIQAGLTLILIQQGQTGPLRKEEMRRIIELTDASTDLSLKIAEYELYDEPEG